jgi:hypothetical protein
MRKGRIDLIETVVIFHSKEDDCWIAHGLHTDQIGAGQSMLKALEDAIRAIDQVLLIAHDEPSVAFLREAPKNIQRLAKSAEPLPRELYEIAHRRVRGEWPDDIAVEVKPDEDSAFKADFQEFQLVNT